jgi:DnaK suppressor protein
MLADPGWSRSGRGDAVYGQGAQPMNVEIYRGALMRKRGELLGGPAAKPLQWTMENNSGRQGDMADQASGTNEVHIQLKLKQTDAKILQAIEDALRRIEQGTYGICKDCGEPIAEARLNAIPWTRSCISCKEKQAQA